MAKRLWQKGQSGNPKGRPKKGQTMTDLLKEYLEEKNDLGIKEDGDLITVKRALIKGIVMLALSGNVQAMQYIINRIDGMPTQAIDMNFDKLEDLGAALNDVFSETENDS